MALCLRDIIITKQIFISGMAVNWGCMFIQISQFLLHIAKILAFTFMTTGRNFHKLSP